MDPVLANVGFPVLGVNGGFDGPYSKSAIDPLYLESLVSFFDRYDLD